MSVIARPASKANLDVRVFRRSRPEAPLTLAGPRNTHLLSLQIQKTMQQPVGGLSAELANVGPHQDWERQIENGDLIHARVDGKLKMLGIINSVGAASTVGDKGQINNRVAIKAADFGILFTNFAQLIHDATWGGERFNLGATFALVFEAIHAAITMEGLRDGYNIKGLLQLTWDKIMTAYSDVAAAMGQPLRFADGSDFKTMFGGARGARLFETVSSAYDTRYPLLVHIPEEHKALWDLWTAAANMPFNEIWADTCYAGQLVDTLDPLTTPVTAEGFRVICRPNPWLGGRFADMADHEYPASKITAVNAVKSAAEVKSLYLVYPASDQRNANDMRATGNYAVDKRLFSIWGPGAQETALNFVDGSEDPIAAAAGLADLLQEGYADIDSYWAGTLAGRYHDVRVGQKILFPRKLHYPTRLTAALAQSVTDKLDFSAGAPKLTTQVTFTRGVDYY